MEILAGEAPEARRASAGILANLNGTETLVIWSGRNKRNKMLQDVWMASLDGPEIVWDRVLDKVPEDELSLVEEVEEEEVSLVEEKGIMDLFRKKKHKKRKKKKKRKRKKDLHFPAPRKGHLALYVESEDRQLMVSLQGQFVIDHCVFVEPTHQFCQALGCLASLFKSISVK